MFSSLSILTVADDGSKKREINSEIYQERRIEVYDK
jgi:hypothetical protein